MMLQLHKTSSTLNEASDDLLVYLTQKKVECQVIPT